MNKNRGTGRTTKQILTAPDNAIYIWCNGNVGYCKKLAVHLGRKDLKVVSPKFLIGRKYLSLNVKTIVIDHAFHYCQGYNERISLAFDDMYRRGLIC